MLLQANTESLMSVIFQLSLAGKNNSYLPYKLLETVRKNLFFFYYCYNYFLICEQ
jgi:hypothetical protein